MSRFLKYWLPVALWMGVIFFMSTNAGSAQNTSRILEPLLRWFVPDISQHAIEWAHFIVRKGGHLSEYGILAMLVWRALMQGETGGAAKRAGWALLISAAYAASDEFHQSFVSTRTASARDVMIDSCGALIALALILWWRRGRPSARCPSHETSGNV